MNLDGYDDAHTNVSGNTFANGGTSIAIGTPVTSAITGIHDNTFKDVADDFNLKNVDAAHPQTFDADATHNTAVASGGDAVWRPPCSRHPRRRYLDRYGRDRRT